MEASLLSSYFTSLSLTQPLAKNLISTTVDAIGGNLRGPELRAYLANAILCEAFALRKQMVTDDFYDSYHTFLNLHGIYTLIIRSCRYILIVFILATLYNDDRAEKTFRAFRKNQRLCVVRTIQTLHSMLTMIDSLLVHSLQLFKLQPHKRTQKDMISTATLPLLSLVRLHDIINILLPAYSKVAKATGLAHESNMLLADDHVLSKQE